MSFELGILILVVLVVVGYTAHTKYGVRLPGFGCVARWWAQPAADAEAGGAAGGAAAEGGAGADTTSAFSPNPAPAPHQLPEVAAMREMAETRLLPMQHPAEDAGSQPFVHPADSEFDFDRYVVDKSVGPQYVKSTQEWVAKNRRGLGSVKAGMRKSGLSHDTTGITWVLSRPPGAMLGRSSMQSLSVPENTPSREMAMSRSHHTMADFQPQSALSSDDFPQFQGEATS